ncbi:MAG: 2-oxoacid:acceptor oxidoreductase family protein, partial [Muribaculaceae bacterium]|nr:2-oxoacid:acceptor oxidoreductase family protein [Muribaculaceae bacterium]
ALKALPNVDAFDMDAVAKEVASPRSANMVLLGAASNHIDLEPSKIEDAIRRVFSAKGDAIVDSNIAAFRAGRNHSKA